VLAVRHRASELLGRIPQDCLDEGLMLVLVQLMQLLLLQVVLLLLLLLQHEGHLLLQ
jgi:hypothetical protein